MKEIEKRIEKCFSFHHSVFHLKYSRDQTKYEVDLDATCLRELKKLAEEFGDDNIVLLPGLPGYSTIKLYIDNNDKQCLITEK